MKKLKFLSASYFLVWLDKHRSLFTFAAILLVIVVSDIAFHGLMKSYPFLIFGEDNYDPGMAIVMDFAPEVWLGLLGLVLGTLIIVISIASQSTPKLIDLYIGDQTSLAYIWFITSGTIHNLFLQLYVGTDIIDRKSSVLLNTYLLLPLSLLFAIPYVLYILKYTKTSNVVEKIYKQNLQLVRNLASETIYKTLDRPSQQAQYQRRIFETLNQLDDLLEFVTFNEPKADIINKLGQSVQHYLPIKASVNPAFFHIGHLIYDDISFKTLTAQFKGIEKAQTFYEQKVYRLLGKAYQSQLEKSDFELAALCAFELGQCGRTAIIHKDEPLIQATIIRFNTFLRFGIKHALRHAEMRNIYNTAFHYSDFVSEMVSHQEFLYVKQSCRYLKVYGSEVFKHSRQEPAFVFLVDVFTLEMKKILIKLYENKADEVFQREVLEMMLDMDNPVDFKRQELAHSRLMNDGVRVMQVALALFYISQEQYDFTELIICDILEDFEHLGEKGLKQAVTSTCLRLQHSTPTFWEDTDRGNANIYYSPDKKYIPRFTALFNKEFQTLLKNRSSTSDDSIS